MHSPPATETKNAADLAAWRVRFKAWHEARNTTDGSHDAGHFTRVWQNCQLLLQQETAQADQWILLASSYFHDLVNPPKNSPDRRKASVLSAEAAVTLLREMQYPLSDAQLAQLHHVIAAQFFRWHCRRNL